MTATLTVLIPAYNTAAYLAEAVRSVLAQTFRNFTLLIIDDGSTDDTLAIAHDLAKTDGRIRVLTQPNAGIANTMNRGLELAQTEWVACMHGDDVMHPERLERQLAFLKENPDLAVASALVYLIDGRGRRLGAQRSPYTRREAVADAARRNRVIAFNHPCAILRKKIVQEVGGYRQAFWPAEDADLWNRIVERGQAVLVQPEYLLNYRLHGASASMSRARVMVRKTEWIESCMRQRRAGVAEPTWEQFLDARAARPWPARLNTARKETARTLYQTAQSDLASRRYARLIPAMVMAAALEPGLVFGRILPRIAHTARSLGRKGETAHPIAGAKGVTA